ncbi:hypothetical protein UA08_03085 [Talaromyces atroroseus]|uniref:Uncharacterized protein n=1 Tax=Talaromyces atroroseus TaxID=1441469 RepID=A0A225APN3_TALAT|nr:hypothetical protein UA08_03085 [Talaromyces atroroseus]OKL61453.1 hypothetical protein UA08_03085 [Talaromyces atroroseus]
MLKRNPLGNLYGADGETIFHNHICLKLKEYDAHKFQHLGQKEGGKDNKITQCVKQLMSIEKQTLVQKVAKREDPDSETIKTITSRKDCMSVNLYMKISMDDEVELTRSKALNDEIQRQKGAKDKERRRKEHEEEEAVRNNTVEEEETRRKASEEEQAAHKKAAEDEERRRKELETISQKALEEAEASKSEEESEEDVDDVVEDEEWLVSYDDRGLPPV